MILLGAVYRVIDGLPLTASTDVDHQRSEVRDCQRYVKLLSKKLSQLPDKCTLSLDGFKIHTISALDMSFLVLCEDRYPTLLAFCFLDEIQREFLLDFDRQKVQSVRRPYAFIQYDSFLQKTKQRYNSPRTLTTRISVSDMSEELKLRPPYNIQELDLASGHYAQANGLPKISPVTTEVRLEPLTWLGMLSIALCVFCALLNLTRGMVIINHGHFDEQDSGAYRYGTAFLISTALCLYQGYQVLRGLHHPTWLAWGTLIGLLLCHVTVSSLRNLMQILFHIASNILATYVVLHRQLLQKGPHHAV